MFFWGTLVKDYTKVLLLSLISVVWFCVSSFPVPLFQKSMSQIAKMLTVPFIQGVQTPH